MTRRGNYQAALRSVKHQNGSDNPSTAQQTVTWIVNDGALTNSPATSTINVTAVNDAPDRGDQPGDPQRHRERLDHHAGRHAHGWRL